MLLLCHVTSNVNHEYLIKKLLSPSNKSPNNRLFRKLFRKGCKLYLSVTNFLGNREAATCPQRSRWTLCRTAASMTADSPTSGDMFYTGSTSLTGSDSDCASRYSNVSTAWLLDTWPSSADRSPASTGTGIYDLLAVASLTFHELDCQHTEDVRSVMLDRLLGTLFLSVSRTMHCLCLTLGTSSNISSSHPTSTPSAFEVCLTVNALFLLTYLLTYLQRSKRLHT